MTTRITYNPTPDPDNAILSKFLEAEPIVDKFKGRSTWEPFWHEGEWVQLYSEDGSVCGGYWDFGGFQCSDDFLKKLEQHPVIRDNVFTGVWIDEAVAYGTMNNPKKQQKPKHNMPYWAKDWRGK